MGGSFYTDFQQVQRDVKAGKFRNESELKQAFVEALKAVLRQACNRYIAENMLVPALDERIKSRRPDIWISNVIIEIEPPGSGLDAGLKQLKTYMQELYNKVRGAVDVYGLVTDGNDAEVWILNVNGEPRKMLSGSMPDMVDNLLRMFCSSKIPVTNPEELVRLFGV